MTSATLTKAVFVAFGLFALMAISASSGSKRQQRAMMAKQEAAKQEVAAPKPGCPGCGPNAKPGCTGCGPEADCTGCGNAADRAAQALSEEKVKTVQEEVKTEAANVAKKSVDVHIHVHEAKPDLLSKAEVKEVSKAIAEPVVEKKPVEKAQVQVEPPVKPAEKPDTVQAEAAPKQAKVVKPASMSILFLPMMAVAAACLVVKFRKPGFLPDAVEEKLESLGYPATVSSDPWGSAPSRSMYGSV